MISRLVLNLKHAALQETAYSIGTISSLHAQTQVENPSMVTQDRMSASVRELGELLFIAGQSKDVDQKTCMESDAAEWQQEVRA